MKFNMTVPKEVDVELKQDFDDGGDIDLRIDETLVAYLSIEEGHAEFVVCKGVLEDFGFKIVDEDGVDLE